MQRLMGVKPFIALSVSVLISTVARGIDFMVSPHDKSVTMSAIAEWADPTALGILLVLFSVIAFLGLIFRQRPVQAVAHIALAALYLVMGLVSFFPVVSTLGWGWRAPISYIFGSAAIHWFAAKTWSNRWVVQHGRTDMDP